MLKDIVLQNPSAAVVCIFGFEDGVEGAVDPGSEISFQEIFARLQYPAQNSDELISR